MPEANRTLLQKAELEVADFTAGGVLQPDQADKFIRLAIKQPVLLKMVTVTPMKAFKEERDKMRFSNRVLRAGNEATPLVAAQWAKPALSLFTLDAQLFKAEVRMSDEVLEDQIERGAFRETLMQELSRAIGRDMEYVAVNGDTTSLDPVLAKFNGILAQANVNIVNAAGAKLSKTVLRDMLRTMPDEFAEDSDLNYFTNRQARIDYRDSLSDRATGLGDLMIQTSNSTKYSDMPVHSVPEFPVAAGTNYTQALLLNPKGIYLGILRNIKVKVDEDISAGVVIIVCTVRFDVKLAEVNAVVKATNLLGG
jgi:HK97 family phage major capsid protein